MFLKHRTILLATLFCGFFLRAYGEIPERLKEFTDGEEEYVRGLAENATALFEDRTRLIQECQCSKHACSNDFDDAACVDYVERYPLCDLVGRRFDFDSSVFRFPPGTSMDNLTDELKQSLCVYRHMEDYVKEHGGPRYLTTYIGTVDGHMRLFPGIPRERYLVDGTNDDYECQPYDPRLRPWFIRASTGPKDIVFVIDKSNSMNDFAVRGEKTTKWDLVRNAVAQMLKTLTFTDFVNIVLFSDDATTVWQNSSLARGTKTSIRNMTETLMQETTHGYTNFRKAFEKAFPLLWNECDTGSIDSPLCSRCEKVILFLTDGRDTSVGGKSIKPSKMAKVIEKQQQKLEKETGKRAAIFTFSMSEQADDAIPRQIACANGGAWTYIGPYTDPLDALNSYYLYLAAGMNSSLPVWIEPYENASGLGTVTTVAVPFHVRHESTNVDIFLGVVGHQVLFEELQDGEFTENQVLDALITISADCAFFSEEEAPCQLQIYRHAESNQGICSDPFPIVSQEEKKAEEGEEEKEEEEEGDGEKEKKEENEKKPSALCYEYRNDFYRRSLVKVSWKRAVERCEEEGGELVSIKHERDLAFLSSLASIDASWIGLKKVSNENFSWLDDRLSDIQKDSDFWGLQEPLYDTGTENCAAIDSRGIIGNLCAKRCDEHHSYICKFQADEPCNGNIGKLPEEGYFKIPPLSVCGDSIEESGIHLPDPGVDNLTSKDVICPIGHPPKTSEEAICCAP